MTVGELIVELGKLDSSALVMVFGREGGWQDVAKVRVRKMELNVNIGGWSGQHELWYSEKDKDSVVDAVTLV